MQTIAWVVYLQLLVKKMLLFTDICLHTRKYYHIYHINVVMHLQM